MKVPNLGYYNPHDKTLVIADASPVGLGAVLVQINKNGPRIIAFGNKTLSSCERRYSQTEKEALALVWASLQHVPVWQNVRPNNGSQTLGGNIWTKSKTMRSHRKVGASAPILQFQGEI